jgi:hypothetical protein
MTRALLFLTLFLSAVSAQGQTDTAGATTTARAHFQEGLARARAGDVTAALREFEGAYAAAPHFSVLYNIGQARATLGRYVEAAAAFERYLAEGGEQVSPKRREEVEALLESARSRVGQLRLIVEEGADNGARVWLDGVEVSREHWDAPIPLSIGEHSLLYTNGRKPAESRRVTIVSQTVVEARLQAPPATPEPKARLVVVCDVPDVRVEVVGLTVTKTPVSTPLHLPAGSWLVKFSRPGYLPVSQTVAAESNRLVEVPCSQREAFPLSPSDSGRLILTTKPADAAVTIDGRRFLHGAALPRGVHRLRVERDGFISIERVISLEAGKVVKNDVTLAPTAAQQARDRAAAAKSRTIGLVLGGVGTAIAVLGGGVYAWNSKRYDDWRASAGRDDLARATSIQRADDAAIGLVILGVVFSSRVAEDDAQPDPCCTHFRLRVTGAGTPAWSRDAQLA